MLLMSTYRERFEPRFSSNSRLVVSSSFLFWAMLNICQAQNHSVLCKGGVGNFDAKFRTEVGVHVGAARSDGSVALATRACTAKLSRKNQDLVVATAVSQLDLDAFGVDMGDGVPVAAFQIKSSDAVSCMEYRIYSLEKMPRLLRTIEGKISIAPPTSALMAASKSGPMMPLL
jgi:hypothetical protein